MVVSTVRVLVNTAKATDGAVGTARDVSKTPSVKSGEFTEDDEEDDSVTSVEEIGAVGCYPGGGAGGKVVTLDIPARPSARPAKVDNHMTLVEEISAVGCCPGGGAGGKIVTLDIPARPSRPGDCAEDGGVDDRVASVKLVNVVMTGPGPESGTGGVSGNTPIQGCEILAPGGKLVTLESAEEVTVSASVRPPLVTVSSRVIGTKISSMQPTSPLWTLVMRSDRLAPLGTRSNVADSNQGQTMIEIVG